MRVGAALSEHPLPTHAAGECVGQLLEEVGPHCDLAVIFVSGGHRGAIEDLARTVREILDPRVLLGATAMGVLGGAREVEEAPGVAMWAARLDVDVEPLRLESHDVGGGTVVLAGAAQLPGRSGTALVLADPFSFPVEGMLEELAGHAPGLRVVGGLASAATGPGGNRLVLGDEVFTDGAVGVWLPEEVELTAVVSQGCRPFGQPLTVTRAEGNIIHELAGRPALERLTEQLAGLDDADRALAATGLQVGVVIDEHRSTFGSGDFLVRAVLGADRAAGAVAVGAPVEIGQTVQFQLRDAAAADEDLQTLMEGRGAAGALVFTCNGRGSRLFGAPDHDAAVVAEHVGGTGIAGMFCAGELGPVGGRNFVHGYTASVLLVGPDRPDRRPADDH